MRSQYRYDHSTVLGYALLIAGAWVGLRPESPLRPRPLRPVLLCCPLRGCGRPLPPIWYFPGRTVRSKVYIMYRINPKPFSKFQSKSILAPSSTEPKNIIKRTHTHTHQEPGPHTRPAAPRPRPEPPTFRAGTSIDVRPTGFV